MKYRNIAWSSLLSLFFAGLQAQELVKINDKSYDVNEFERVYTKNIDLLKDSEQKDIDNYMDLFVLYKLKVDKAYDLGLDKKESYINELAQHRKQLAEKYFTDEKKLEALTLEAYERSLKEREASHLLIAAGLNAVPEDTLKAYNKALSIYNEIKKGKPFAEAAVEYSEDPSAKENKGYLGYFSVFRMVYPFEQGAFTTPVGTVSKPVRSQFGYHLVYVSDERPARYVREVFHLYIDAKKHTPEQAGEKAKQAYAELQSGTPFSEVVKKYSDESNVAETEGLISMYRPGVMDITGFDDAVYEIEKEQSYSEPFESEWGWHIVKVGKISPYPTFEESKMNLRHRVATDARAQVMKKDLLQHLKQRYDYKVNQKNWDKAMGQITDEIYDNAWKRPKNAQVIATFSEEKVSADEFLEYVEKNSTRNAFIRPAKEWGKQMYEEYISNRLEKYYDSRLEKDFPEFRNTMQEYREGLLLFDLMDQEIWTKTKTDTLGYTSYFERNKERFKKEASFDGRIAEFATHKEAKKAMKLFNKNKNIETVFLKIKPQSQQEKQVLISSDPSFSKINEKDNQSVFVDGNKLIYVEHYHPESYIDLEEVRGRVLQEYQDEYEKRWIGDLKNSARVNINSQELKQLKRKYSQE